MGPQLSVNDDVYFMTRGRAQEGERKKKSGIKKKSKKKKKKKKTRL